MKKILLVAINSRYNHVALAVRQLESYVKKYSPEYKKTFLLETKYFTINQPLLEIIRDIVSQKPDAVLFSVYIWNVLLTMQLIPELKKIIPSLVIACGGPEVSYCSEDVLKKNSKIDFIMSGEGEETVLEFCNTFAGKENIVLKNIRGLYIRSENKIEYTGQRELIKNLDDLPFCYDDGNGQLVSDLSAENSIIYYESSRGCPFSCSYCLSSVEKSVRFKSLECVKKDIDFFMKNKVCLVKFVDRTFNLKEERYIAIWNYIKENWNGITKFHFEIEAQTMTDSALKCLEDVPFNCMQFEIGIQSINQKTLEAVGRTYNPLRQQFVLSNISQSIHVHLDLIAGLPYESLKEFATSYDYAISQKCHMLQLGFLKILHGTQMEQFAKKYKGYEYLSLAPYEVLFSPWVNYSEMLFLKHLDFLTDVYFNSQEYFALMHFIISLQKSNRSTYNFFVLLEKYFVEQGLFDNLHKSTFFFDVMYDFFNSGNLNNFLSPQEIFTACELLKFDYIRKGKTSVFPLWYKRNYNKERHVQALNVFHDMHSTRQAFIDSAFEEFNINPFTYKKIDGISKCEILFIYNTNHIKTSASKTAVRSGDTLCIEVSSLLSGE